MPSQAQKKIIVILIATLKALIVWEQKHMLKMSIVCASAGCDGHTDGSVECSVNTMPAYPGGAFIKADSGN